MKAEQILNSTLKLLGHSEIENDISVKAISLAALNTVYADLFYLNHKNGFKPLACLNDEILLSEKLLFDVMTYGVAAYIAAAKEDLAKQQLFASLYNIKRAGAKEEISVVDKLPKPIS